ncbi:MAG: DUF4190 domain-containing protein [Anaerolineae bacterium]|nr:DUF4190 domain-containing protein [Anaerolineae bacterium]
MNCPTCGAPNPEGATSCQECGRTLPQSLPEASPSLAPPTSDVAVASLVCGILSWSFLPFVGAILAVILGHVAKTDIQNSDGALGGDGIATLGLLLGYANLGLAALALIGAVLLTALGIAIPIWLGISGACGAMG